MTTPAARTFEWKSLAVADEAGRAEVDVPYYTGRNGNVTATAASVQDGVRVAAVSVRCAAVTDGERVTVALVQGDLRRSASAAH